eukprot:11228332-Lingulodinium_polyedra.AAC.3
MLGNGWSTAGWLDKCWIMVGKWWLTAGSRLVTGWVLIGSWQDHGWAMLSLDNGWILLITRLGAGWVMAGYWVDTAG